MLQEIVQHVKDLRPQPDGRIGSVQGIELGVEDTVGEDVAHATSLPAVPAVCRHADVPLRERAS
jgi:hypothetical protein